MRQRGHGERSSVAPFGGSKGCEEGRREQELGEVVREGLESQTGCSAFLLAEWDVVYLLLYQMPDL